MKIKTLPKLDYIKDVINYEPDTGKFYWKKNRGGKALAGSIAGTLRKDGYIDIRLGGKKYLAHRIAWLYSYGSIPENSIDHINGNTADNRLINLRICKHIENCLNRGKNRNNSTGHKNISECKSTSKNCKNEYYLVSIMIHGTPYTRAFNKKSASALEDAIAWRDAQLLEHAGSFAKTG